MSLRLKVRLMLILFIFVSVDVISGMDLKGDIINLEIAPNEHFSHEVTVAPSISEGALNISAEIKGISVSPEGVTTAIAADKDNYPYSARSFLAVSPANFILEPGNNKVILLEGDIPKDVGSGTRYAMLMISSVPAKSESNGSSAAISGAINLPITIEIVGTNLTRTGEISDLTLEEPITSEKQDLSLTFDNTGNTHYRTLAKADLLDKDGMVISNSATPLTKAAVLPGTSRVFHLAIEPDKKLEPGSYLINATVCLKDESVIASKEIEFEV